MTRALARGTAAVLFVVAAACTATPTPPSSATASAVSVGTPTPGTSTSTPLPAGTITPPNAGVSARATRVPREHRYVAAAEAAVGRIWLVDLEPAPGHPAAVAGPGPVAPAVVEADGNDLLQRRT